MLLASSSRSGEMGFSKTVDIHKLSLELKSSTGFHFGTAPSTGTNTGYIKGNSSLFNVVVYETPGGVKQSTATFNQSLQDLITTTVNNHTP